MKKLSLIGLLFLALFACREDIDETITSGPDRTPIIISEYEPEMDIVTGTIFGLVYDENDNPVQDAVVNYDGKTFTTDVEGRFIIKDEALDRQGTFFTVEADGYFRGSSRIYPRDNSVNYANIQLLSLNDIGSFNAADGGELEGPDGLKISFPPNSIQSADGSLSNGQVSVAAKWLDPTADNIGEIMPGDLLGLNSRVEEVALVSYGMMAVELFDENGLNVNIAEGNAATLSFPVPQELMDEAPQEIPLWSFEDEQYGIWAEEGTATLQGNNYVGEVSHFSFWNCDAPFPLVYIEGQLLTPNGTPLANSSISIFAEGSNSRRYGTTDNEGYFAGKMPKDIELVLNIGSDCNFGEINLGSFSTGTNIGQITLEETGSAFSITGNIIDCDDDLLVNALIRVDIGNRRTEFYLNGEGDFEIGVLNCDNAEEVSITAVDVENLEEGMTKSLPIESEVNFGTVSACGTQFTEFFTLTLNGETVTTVQGLGATIHSGGSLRIEAEIFDSMLNTRTFDFRLEMISSTIGTYSAMDIIFMAITASDSVFNSETILFCKGNCNSLDPATIIINENGGVGEHLAGEFNGEGTLTNNDGTPFNVTLNGSFRLPISQ